VIGLAVAHVADDALIAAHRLGSWRANVAYQGNGSRSGRKPAPSTACIARKVKDNEKVEWEQLYVDIGARNGRGALARRESATRSSVVAPPLELANRRIASRSLDNRAGVYVALEGAPAARGREHRSRRRRSGGRSSVRRARRCNHAALRPDVAIALDVTYATDVPGDDAATGGHHVLGGGRRSSAARPSTHGCSSCCSRRRGRKVSTTRWRRG
jgi:endoglucanase